MARKSTVDYARKVLTAAQFKAWKRMPVKLSKSELERGKRPGGARVTKSHAMPLRGAKAKRNPARRSRGSIRRVGGYRSNPARKSKAPRFTIQRADELALAKIRPFRGYTAVNRGTGKTTNIKASSALKGVRQAVSDLRDAPDGIHYFVEEPNFHNEVLLGELVKKGDKISFIGLGTRRRVLHRRELM